MVFIYNLYRHSTRVSARISFKNFPDIFLQEFYKDIITIFSRSSVENTLHEIFFNSLNSQKFFFFFFCLEILSMLPSKFPPDNSSRFFFNYFKLFLRIPFRSFSRRSLKCFIRDFTEFRSFSRFSNAKIVRDLSKILRSFQGFF